MTVSRDRGSFVEQVERAEAMLSGARLREPDSAEQARRRKAALYVAGQARDADDCTLLLDTLGLLGTPDTYRSTVRGKKIKVVGE
jgi:hypothetical protein